jgi:hypothetical protein
VSDGDEEYAKFKTFRAAEDQLQAAIQREWENWSRNASVEDRILYSSWVPSIEGGDSNQIGEVSALLLENRKSGSASEAALNYLTSLALKKCLDLGIAVPAPSSNSLPSYWRQRLLGTGWRCQENDRA